MMTENTKTEYFDLITSGLGYLNRSRKVTPNQGPATEDHLGENWGYCCARYEAG